ncbi:hypothetical protein Salat_0593500 [Sesamum alatum]|uniref:Uncharacterized protein n=1 Tax=Sesamum alatum TaxID=300844 RepID=A0AAE1YQH5_9LAMI|nr:hypothetical protein Salat_0593500 [Sesamum alatum]
MGRQPGKNGSGRESDDGRVQDCNRQQCNVGSAGSVEWSRRQHRPAAEGQCAQTENCWARFRNGSAWRTQFQRWGESIVASKRKNVWRGKDQTKTGSRRAER